MEYRKAIYITLVIVFAACQAFAVDYYVNAELGSDASSGLSPEVAWRTITHALSAAEADKMAMATIHIAAGTYSASTNGEAFPLQMKSFVSLAGAGSASTVLDAEGAAQVIVIRLASNLTIEGLTITGGDATKGYSGGKGGGILCQLHSTPVIQYCRVSGNRAVEGGGICCWESCPSILHNTISGNSAEQPGGGIYCFYGSSPAITHNTIAGNSAGWDGGGIWCLQECSPDISDNTISENSAGDGGGGIGYYYRCSPAITNNRIADNQARIGGGIGCQDSWTTAEWAAIESNTITGNSAECGAGISCYQCSPAIHNNVIEKNTSSEHGGGLFCSFAAFPIVQNNLVIANKAADGGGAFCYERPSSQHRSTVFSSDTIVGNRAELGGGIYCEDSPATIFDCILWDNRGELHGCSPTYSCIEGGSDGEGNISDDPLFTSGPQGDHYLSCVAAGQTANSPCIDAGSELAKSLGLDSLTTQTDGMPDIGMVDMGYHYPVASSSEPPTVACFLNEVVFAYGDPLVGYLEVENPIAETFVDVYIAFVMPDGALLCLTDRGLETELRPWAAGACLPGGLTFGPEAVLSTVVPDGTPLGCYTFAAALTESGTVDFLSNPSLFPFTVEAR